MACKHAKANCEALPFHTMPVIETSDSIIYDGKKGKIVNCTEFTRPAPYDPTSVQPPSTRRPVLP